MRLIHALAVCLLAVSAIAPAGAQTRSAEPPVWRTISRFTGEDEFMRYLGEVRDAARRARMSSFLKQAAPADCPPELFPCQQDAEDQAIVVTGSRIPSPARAAASAPQATSITNVQNAGVDEGDIVKLYGRFLIVLQDGRLFSVDTGATAGAMRLVDRVNVYRRASAGAWYDEILISDNRVVVTGYNYGESATEFSVFSIDRGGHFTREAVYFLSSNDYYDNENYATRLVNGNLVIYTPLFVGELQADARPRWPLVRRWLSEDEHRAASTRGRNLIDATDIYHPIQATYDPVVHTISVCPLGAPRAGDELECHSTALVAPPGREFYVSTSDIYLWTWPVWNQALRRTETADCAAREPDSFARAMPAALFQISLSNGEMRAQFVRGQPYDQLSMDANDREFRALAVWHDTRCNTPRDPGGLPLRYLDTPLSAFSVHPRPASERRYADIPSVGAAIENRFTDNYLVYAGRSEWSSYAPSPDSEAVQETRVVAVPTESPRQPTLIEAPHSALRVERVGDNVIVSGYRDWRGLSISLIDLRGAPRLSSTVFLSERYESEGRSHAFNAAIDADGAGLMGLPTVMRRAQSGRWWWRSASSDVSYVALDAGGRLTSIGALRGASPKHPDYRCEVSCIDWYGNTRAVFVAGRVFALSGTELIEGQITDDGIADLDRVNLTGPVGSGRIAER
jgi:hypothetical protein